MHNKGTTKGDNLDQSWYTIYIKNDHRYLQTLIRVYIVLAIDNNWFIAYIADENPTWITTQDMKVACQLVLASYTSNWRVKILSSARTLRHKQVVTHNSLLQKPLAHKVRSP